MVEPLSSHFRVFTVKLEGVRKFRNLAVGQILFLTNLTS